MIKEASNDLRSDFKEIFDNINDPFSKMFVYQIENKNVGFINYSIIYDRIELNYIYIYPNYRKQGYAKKLLDYLINNEKFENITLEVDVNNIAAINLYHKFNFEKVAVRKNYYKNSDALLMIRKSDNYEKNIHISD